MYVSSGPQLFSYIYFLTIWKNIHRSKKTHGCGNYLANSRFNQVVISLYQLTFSSANIQKFSHIQLIISFSQCLTNLLSIILQNGKVNEAQKKPLSRIFIGITRIRNKMGPPLYSRNLGSAGAHLEIVYLE